MSLRLHSKHGLNPTIKTCFFCSEQTNEIVLLGATYKERAPATLIMDYKPCDKCLELMGQGFTLIEVVNKPVPNRGNKAPLTIDGTHVPTGRWWVITMEAAHQMFAEEICNQKKALINQEVAAKLGIPNA